MESRFELFRCVDYLMYILQRIMGEFLQHILRCIITTFVNHFHEVRNACKIVYRLKMINRVSKHSQIDCIVGYQTLQRFFAVSGAV